MKCRLEDTHLGRQELEDPPTGILSAVYRYTA